MFLSKSDYKKLQCLLIGTQENGSYYLCFKKCSDLQNIAYYLDYLLFRPVKIFEKYFLVVTLAYGYPLRNGCYVPSDAIISCDDLPL